MVPSASSPTADAPLLEQALAQAASAYDANNWPHAERLCRLILGTAANHAPALNLLGLIAAQSDRLHEAVALFRQSAASNPRDPFVHSNLGNALRGIGDSSSAINSYAVAIALDPDNPSAHNNLAAALADLGRYEAALSSLDQALRVCPDSLDAGVNRVSCLLALDRSAEAVQAARACLDLAPDSAVAHQILGMALSANAQFEEAATRLLAAIQLDPGNVDALLQLGTALQSGRQHKPALAAFDHAIRLAPDLAEAHGHRGATLLALERHAEAISSLELAIQLDPGLAQAHACLGAACNAAEQYPRALVHLNRAVELRPDLPEAFSNRGVAYRGLGDLQAAVADYQQAIALAPGFAQAHANLAYVRLLQNQHDAALQSCDQALQLDPDCGDALVNKGVALNAIGQPAEALQVYEDAIQRQPSLVDAYWNAALIHLQLGHIERGWALYEWRKKRPDFLSLRARSPDTLWQTDQPLRGKSILLHWEQGLGDTLQFCRYARLLADRGARVILEVQPPLVALLKGLDGVAQVVPSDAATPRHDLHYPLMSLPHAFGTVSANIPGTTPYLKADASKIAEWGQRLNQDGLLRVGLAWSGSPTHRGDLNRSMALADWVPHLPEGPQYVCLQKDVRPADADTLRKTPQIRQFGPLLRDFSDTAALCDWMDLVICVDTSIAHLAGAMAKPVWIMLAQHPDWRWMLERTDSPWYPTARLFRQTEPGNWSGVFAQVRIALDHMLSAAPSHEPK